MKMMPSSPNEEQLDVENSKLDKDKERTPRSARVIEVHNQALLSGLAYCFSSCGMILVNKFVLSSYDFNVGISLMLYQLNSLQYIRINFEEFCAVVLSVHQLEVLDRWEQHVRCVYYELYASNSTLLKNIFLSHIFSILI